MSRDAVVYFPEVQFLLMLIWVKNETQVLIRRYAVISSDHLHGHKEKNDLGNADCPLLKVDFSSIFK